MEHYIESHGVETDEDGCLMDLGIDVDVRVKDTKSLLQLADGRVDDNVPEKTVLIRKKPRQSWQCKVGLQMNELVQGPLLMYIINP